MSSAIQSYLARYERGDREAVWQELVDLGVAVRQEPLLSEARAVAQAMMQRALHNVELIVARLQALGYAFERRPHAPPTPAALAALARLEQRCGPLPLVVRAWFEVVGDVDLMGRHPLLSCAGGKGQGPVSDPLMIVNDAADFFDEIDDAAEEGDDLGPPFDLMIGLDSDQKAGSSGGGGEIYASMPCPVFDAPLLAGDSEGPAFVPYLRECFALGGFPGLAGQQAALAAARSELDLLTRDLLPL